LDPAWENNAVFAMNSATRGAAMTIVNSQGAPIFLVGGAGNASTQGGGFDSILGHRVVYNQYIANYSAGGTSPAVLYGDFESAHTLRIVSGSFELLHLQERYAELGMYGVIAYGRAGAYANYSGISAAKPVIALTQHA
jgi:HK97 family phage major capsid protein